MRENNNRNLNESGLFGAECTICLKKFNKDKVYLNCNHYFHKECIQNWKTRNNTCPICRAQISQIKEQSTAKDIIKLIISSAIFLFILYFFIELVLMLSKAIIPLIINIGKIPIIYLYTLLKGLVDIVRLLIIIFYKFCKRNIPNSFSFISDVFKRTVEILMSPFNYIFNNSGLFFNGIINQLNKIKKRLEIISRDL